MIVMIPTSKTVVFMGEKIQVPWWCKYIALDGGVNGKKADIVGFTHKPYITHRYARWALNTNAKDGRMEKIGYVTNYNIKWDDAEAHLQTLIKLPETA